MKNFQIALLFIACAAKLISGAGLTAPGYSLTQNSELYKCYQYDCSYQYATKYAKNCVQVLENTVIYNGCPANYYCYTDITTNPHLTTGTCTSWDLSSNFWYNLSPGMLCSSNLQCIRPDLGCSNGVCKAAAAGAACSADTDCVQGYECTTTTNSVFKTCTVKSVLSAGSDCTSGTCGPNLLCAIADAAVPAGLTCQYLGSIATGSYAGHSALCKTGLRKFSDPSTGTSVGWPEASKVCVEAVVRQGAATSAVLTPDSGYMCNRLATQSDGGSNTGYQTCDYYFSSSDANPFYQSACSKCNGYGLSDGKGYCDLLAGSLVGNAYSVYTDIAKAITIKQQCANKDLKKYFNFGSESAFILSTVTGLTSAFNDWIPEQMKWCAYGTDTTTAASTLATEIDSFMDEHGPKLGWWPVYMNTTVNTCVNKHENNPSSNALGLTISGVALISSLAYLLF